VLRVREVVAALADAGSPAEVVDRDRLDPALPEAKRELLVEPVEAADVRKDDDTSPAALIRHGREGGEAVPVFGLEDEVLVRHRCP
jgi:hypothetical protein